MRPGTVTIRRLAVLLGWRSLMPGLSKTPPIFTDRRGGL